MIMSRLTLILSAALPLIACDLDDQSLGDTSGGQMTESSTSGASTDPTQATSDSQATSTSPTTGASQTSGETDPSETDECEPGSGGGDECFRGIRVRLDATEYYDGDYVVQLLDEQDGLVHECAFSMPEGASVSTACIAHGNEARTTISVSMENNTLEVDQPLRLVVSRADVTFANEVVAPTYEFDEDPCTGELACITADLTLNMDEATEATCEALGTAFDAEFVEVRGCEEASECGQVLSGYSCGCTNNWVARLDADPAELDALAQQGQTLECNWAFFKSDCSCPEADGFTCREDGICDWNLL